LKKIDLHIHTVPTISDSAFTFCLDVFERYVEETQLDAVAITNHDVFDAAQFREIGQRLDIPVFPGIEINVEKGHVLIIGNVDEVDDFAGKAHVVSTLVTNVGDSISVEKLESIFGDLGRYLVIPHYDKSPRIAGETLEKLKRYMSAGEVDSPKKFIRNIRDETKPSPVLFSDLRIRAGLEAFPTRHTFVDCGTPSLRALKECLSDKSKVSLSEHDGNRLWQALGSGLKLSTGLNVVIGPRSSGKTHTLDLLDQNVENVKYIRQFSLVQHDEAASERAFKSDVDRRRSAVVHEYLSGLKRILDEVAGVDLEANERRVERYIETLLRAAEETDRHDAFSKAALFDEVELPIGGTTTLRDLISSVRQVIENQEYRPIVERHVDLVALRRLAMELIERLWQLNLDNEKKRLVNGLISEIKQGLKIRTSAAQVEDVDVYEVMMDQRRIERFSEVVRILQEEAVIFEESLQGFKVEAKRMPFTGAGEIKSASGLKTAFSGAFQHYPNPYMYLRDLLANEDIPRSDLYKLFVKIGYRVLNEDGFEVSGGERSEFRLLQEIKDAQNYDMLLIDEPESSFDNIFLNSNVNQILRSIAETMPVVVVTHNNTVGASVGADYLLHTRKDVDNGDPVYRVYSGYPTDSELVSLDGRKIYTHDVMMDSLEAGSMAYESRRRSYEATKNPR
jgi:hypothetical protein